MIRDYINKIGETNDREKMEELGDMLEELVLELKESHHEVYDKYKNELYELAYGKTISKEMATEWVKSMKPVGEHWNIEATTSAKESLGYVVDSIDFYVVANMIYNDYYDIVKDNETLALELAKDWLNDEDAIEDKLYCYWKHIVKK